MAGQRRIDPADPRPLWKQIEDGIRQEVALGKLSPGDPVPSVRELARELRVNPNTVARAIQSLADGGIVETRRGDGTYVADSPPQTSQRERKARLEEAAQRVVLLAATLGAGRDEVAGAIEEAWTQLGPHGKDRRS